MSVSMRTCLAVVFLWGAAAWTDPVVKTPLGELRGHRMTSRGGREFLAFSGVPYAEPPVGQLMFESPRPLQPWSGVRDAKENPPWCMQYNLFDGKPDVFGQLDCLYLSVFTHNLKGKAPVLVHFHGGGYISGNTNNTGPQYMMDEDVVIVDVNYRVGFFGFLSFEDKDMPGNQGLKDQVQSLRWVQQNIASFGGDPNRVTLVGESAGAGSVYHHIVSPLTHGLFHGTIAESGTSYAYWAVAPEGSARKMATDLLAYFNHTYTTTKEAVDFLRRQDPKVVSTKLENHKVWQIDTVHKVGPALEPPGPDAFLVGPVSHWQHKPVPLLLGTTSAEGLLRTLYFPYVNMSYKWYNDNFERLAPMSLQYLMSSSNPKGVAKAIKKFYFESGNITENDWRNLTTMYSDSWFTISVIDGANNHTGDVFFYYFDYLGDKSFAGNSTARNDSIVFGAFHTDEILYLWRNPFLNGLKGEDLAVSRKLVKVWTDFAKYGKPDSEGSLSWRKWTPARHRYMHINKKGFNMAEGFAEDRYRFWKSIPYRDLYQ